MAQRIKLFPWVQSLRPMWWRRELTPVLVICPDDISSPGNCSLFYIQYKYSIGLVIGICSGLILAYSGLCVHPDLRSHSCYITLTCCVNSCRLLSTLSLSCFWLALECNTSGLGSALFVPFPHHGTCTESTALTQLSFCRVECVADYSVIESRMMWAEPRRSEGLVFPLLKMK